MGSPSDRRALFYLLIINFRLGLYDEGGKRERDSAAKRRIRESYRLNKEILVAPQGCRTNILFVYVSKDIKEFSYIEEKVKDILALVTKGKTKGEKKDGAQQSESNS